MDVQSFFLKKSFIEKKKKKYQQPMLVITFFFFIVFFFFFFRKSYVLSWVVFYSLNFVVYKIRGLHCKRNVICYIRPLDRQRRQTPVWHVLFTVLG